MPLTHVLHFQRFVDWPHRLVVRTRLFQGRGTGSSPVGATSQLISSVRPIRRVSPGWLSCARPCLDRDRVIGQLAKLPAVRWIEPYVEPELHNNDSLGPIQVNVPTAGDYSNLTLFNQAITGTGQIVAVADSGNDSDMCFFRTLNGTTEATDASETNPPTLGPPSRTGRSSPTGSSPGRPPMTTTSPVWAHRRRTGTARTRPARPWETTTPILQVRRYRASMLATAWPLTLSFCFKTSAETSLPSKAV